ncbi:MAG TPA: DUF433 domain-containing protein [Opitutus sp.]|nr:DUF433 domain-containing protein [Opitutus sp.]
MRLLNRITLKPGRRSGKPCIRDTRITVYDVFGYLAAGMTESEILQDFPDIGSGSRPCRWVLLRNW